MIVQPLAQNQQHPHQSYFPSPWLDYASHALPTSHEEIMWWSQYLWLMDGTYRSAMERVASHFLTQLDFPDLDIEEENEWRHFFSTIFDYRSELLACAYDFLTYGNLFVGLYLPFVRIARCRKCMFEQPIQQLEDYNIEFVSEKPYIHWLRVVPCPKCGDTSEYEVFDRRLFDLNKVVLNRYSPHEIEIAYNRYSRRKEIFWKIPEDERRRILTKGRIYIEDTPLEVLEAVASYQYMRFDEDYLLHVSEPTLSGIQANGWGLPRALANFRAAWMQQIANKTDQAVMLDYMLGIRMISPANAGPTDPMMSRGMQEFVTKVSEIIAAHRRNPTTYHTVPYPLQYVFMGGEGNHLVTHEKLQMRQRDFLSQMGVPLEYHQMTLQAQAAPMALRLFEMYWQSIPSLYNKILDWIVTKVSKAFNLPATRVVMQRTTVVDDMQYRSLLMQLMVGNQVSPQTALQPLGINAAEEIKKVFKHQDYLARVQREYDEMAHKRDIGSGVKDFLRHPNAIDLAQQEQAAAQGQGVPPASGGIPPTMDQAQAGDVPDTLAGVSQYAKELAQQLVVTPEYERKQQLRALRETNKELHALVLSYMDQIRRQAASQGQQIVLQQQYPPM